MAVSEQEFQKLLNSVKTPNTQGVAQPTSIGSLGRMASPEEVRTNLMRKNPQQFGAAGAPVPTDVTATAPKMDLSTIKQDAIKKAQLNWLNVIPEFGIGSVKQFGKAVDTLSAIGQAGLAAITPGKQEIARPPTELREASNIAQKAGQITTEIAEYAVPAMATAGAITPASGVLGYLQNIAVEAGIAGAVTALNRGKVDKEVAKTAGLSALTTGVLGAPLGAAVKKVSGAIGKLINSEVDDVTRNVLQRTAKENSNKFNEYANLAKNRIQEGTDFIDNPTPTPIGELATKVENEIGKMQTIKREAGKRVGEVIKSAGNKVVSNIDDTINSFVKNIEDAGYSVSNKGEIVLSAGRRGKLSESALSDLQGVYNELLNAAKNKTVGYIDDTISQLDNMIEYDPITQKIKQGSNFERIISQTRKNLSENVKQAAGEEYQLAKEGYSAISKALDFVGENVGDKAQRVYNLIRRVTSERSKEAIDTLKTIEKVTGENLFEDAVLVNFVMRKMASQETKSLFEQGISSGVRAFSKTGIFDLVSQGIGKFVTNPERVANKIIKEAAGNYSTDSIVNLVRKYAPEITSNVLGGIKNELLNLYTQED